MHWIFSLFLLKNNLSFEPKSDTMKTNTLSLLILLFVAFASCKKDDDKASVTLTSKTWKRAMVDKNMSTNPVTNPAGNVLYYAPQDFEKDDTFKFSDDGKLTINRGTLKASNDQPQTEVQSYSFVSATQQLTINGEKYTLVEQNKTQLKYYTLLPPVSGFRYLIFIFE